MAKPEDIKPFAGVIRKQALRLVNLSEDIIQLSQLEESDDEDMSFESVNLYEIAQRCVEALNINAINKGVTLNLTGEECYIRGKAQLVEELVYNLCDNAIRYNKENGNDVISGTKFTVVAGVCSLLAVVCYLLCYALTTERVRAQATDAQLEKNNLGVMLKNAVKNRALISIIVASIFMLISQLTIQQMANYVFPNYYGNAKVQSLSVVMMGGGMVIAAVIAKPLAAKFGKAEISVVSNMVAGVVSLLLYFVRPQNVWVYVALQFLCWFGLGVFSMVVWALITDVIDYSEIKNGIREDGSVYALYSFARKLGQALTSGLSGALLSMIGYKKSTAFESQVKEGIFDISTLVPAISFILLDLFFGFGTRLRKNLLMKMLNFSGKSIIKQKNKIKALEFFSNAYLLPL